MFIYEKDWLFKRLIKSCNVYPAVCQKWTAGFFHPSPTGKVLSVDYTDLQAGRPETPQHYKRSFGYRRDHFVRACGLCLQVNPHRRRPRLLQFPTASISNRSNCPTQSSGFDAQKTLLSDLISAISGRPGQIFNYGLNQPSPL